MLTFPKLTMERVAKSRAATGDLGNVLLAKASNGQYLRVQFTVQDEDGTSTPQCWAFPAMTPEHRIRKIRDNLVHDMEAGRFTTLATLERVRLIVRKHVADLQVEEAKFLLAMA